jgi:hypothetical protein
MADMSLAPTSSLHDPGLFVPWIAERPDTDAGISTLVRRHVPLAT